MGIGPGSYGTICLGSRHEPGQMGLAPGPQPLVPVLGMNRDRRSGFSTGSSHEPGQMSCLYIPHRRSRALHSALFFLAVEGRAFGCSSSPPMHMRCSMKCLSHTSSFSSRNSTSELHFPRDLSRFSGPSRPVPVFTAVDRLRRSRRQHHRGEPHVLIFFLKEKNSYFR